ncbi:MFS transporter [Kitasatospora purpeofusca]|uniref:MFS transporter n=1 Tax=Kitasatospora purpeofusca TaxID=67352 RepID=UPI00338FB0E2
MGGVLFVVFNGYTFFYAMHLQRSAGAAPLRAGLLMTPAALALLLAAAASSRMLSRCGARRTAAVGAAAVVGGTCMLSALLRTGPGLVQLTACLILGSGAGILNSCVGIVVSRSVPSDGAGRATGVLAAARMLGGAVGVVVVSVVLTAGYRHALTSPGGPGAQIGPGQRQEALQLPPSVAPGRQSLAAPLPTPSTPAWSGGCWQSRRHSRQQRP